MTTIPRWRELYVLAGMRAMSFAGDVAAATAMTLYLQSHRYPPAFIVATLVAAAAPAVLFAPLTGRISDRYDSRTIVVVAALSQVVLCLAMAAWLNPYGIVAITALISVGLAFTHPVLGGLPRSMVGPENVTRAASISQTSAMAGMLAAPALGAFLTGAFGAGWALIFDGLSFALVAAGALFITTRLHSNGGTVSASSENAARTTQSYSVWRDPLIRILLGATGMVVVCVSISSVIGVYLVRDALRASEQQYGLVGSVWMAGLVVGGLIAGKARKFSPRAQVLTAYMCMGIALVIAAIVPSVWVLAPAWLLGGVGNGMMAANLHVILNLEVPDAHRGRAFAALNLVSNAAPMTGYLLGGVLLAAVGPRLSYTVIGVLACLCGFVASPLLFNGSWRRTLTVSPPVDRVNAA